MSNQSEIYWRTKVKYAVMSTILTFFVGGIFGFIFEITLPPGMSLNGFIALGFYSIAVLWTGILIGRYLIRFGIIKKPI